MGAKTSVWITGTGAVSCLGGDTRELWSAVLEEKSGVRDGLGRVDDSFLAAPTENRALAFCLQGAREAMARAGWKALNPDDGLILATTTGLLLQWDAAFARLVAGDLEKDAFRSHFLNQPLGELAREVSQGLAHAGPSTVLTSACSASTQALALGAMWIREGRVKRCLVGGVEVLCDLTCEGFRSLQLLSNEIATPFDRDRKGINLSEGAAFLCLESAAFGLARLSGFGFTSDAFHMTGPNPEGEGCLRAMRQALTVARLDARDVDWVHAHGTGSQANDLAEGQAIARLFGEHAPWVSSTKWLHGHPLGAAGALETVLIVEALREGTILRTRGLCNPDERIPVRHPNEDLRERAKHVLKNTLGFGGANAALVISSAEAAP